MRNPRLPSIALILSAAAACPTASRAAAPPDLGPNVIVFDPSMPAADVQRRCDQVFATQEQNQFGPDRTALLFKPGAYAADVHVGFYTSVLGLGASPDDVRITGGVRATAEWLPPHNATCNFWRAAENLSVVPTSTKGGIGGAGWDKGTDIWAVSQGADLRRLHVRGNLKLWDGGWASGGFLADCKIDGHVESGSQQQWISRNDTWSSWQGGNWNMVFVGANSPPSGTWPGHPYTVVPKTPVGREKPYLMVDAAGAYAVQVPAVQKDSRGCTWANGHAVAKAIPIDHFHVARADRDTAATINAALAAGQDLLLTPGVYHLDAAIHVTRPGTVVLGIGYPTLIPDRGTAAIAVDDVDGATVAGLIFDAGVQTSPSLLEVGPAGSKKAAHAADPTCLFDIVARAGGATAGKAATFVTVNSNNVINDNLWLWRADHGEGAGWETNPTASGLVVNGDDVTCYGLFVEHTQGFETLWNGNGGRVYFYQSELPYDVPSQAAWSHDGVNGFASYKVAPAVKTHEAWGLGVYSNFTAAPVLCQSAIEVPNVPGVKVHHVVTIYLSGQAGSGITHGVNQQGPSVLSTKQMKAQMD